MSEKKLALFVEAPVTEARIEREWEVVRARLPEARRRSPVAWASLGGAVVAVGIIAFLLISRPVPTDIEGTALDSAGDHLSMALPDGSHIELDPSARIEVRERSKNRVRVELTRGRAEFDVARDPERKFVVVAGAVEVEVIGTRFFVERGDGERVRVEVERGIVAVHARGETHRLTAGSTWSSDQVAAAVVPEAPEEPEADAVVEGLAEDAPVEELEESEDVAQVEERTAPRPRKKAQSRSRTRRKERPLDLSALDAPGLFDVANTARRRGDLRDAAMAYARMLSRFPQDPRTGLAAFELGRLRMDSLADPQGAITALQRAIAIEPEAGYREDAMARLVYAYESLGAPIMCTKARDGYLAEFPKGAHATALAGRCK
jgi:transmembrane sensor